MSQLNIHDGAFFAKAVFSNFETFMVEKKLSTHESDMKWLTKVTKMLFVVLSYFLSQ